MNTPRLPLDIVEHVLQYLKADPTSLCNCSIVCRAFVRPSRKHIFSIIPLDGPHYPSDRAAERLYYVLMANPEILSYVKTVYIWWRLREMMSGDFFQQVIMLLSHGHNLRGVAIWICSSRKRYAWLPSLWTRAKEHTAHALEALITVPQLRVLRVQFSDRSFPFDLLEKVSPELQTLSIMGDLWSSRDIAAKRLGTETLYHSLGNNPVPALQFLAFRGSDAPIIAELLDNPRYPLQSNRLRRMSLDGLLNDESSIALNSIVQGATETLERIVWYSPSLSIMLSVTLNLELLNRLDTLIFVLPFDEKDKLLGLFEVIEKIPFPMSLCHLVIILLSGVKELVTFDLELQSAADDGLHNVLFKKGHCLTKISVHLLFPEIGSEPLGNVAISVRESFPKLDSMKKVRIRAGNLDEFDCLYAAVVYD